MACSGLFSLKTKSDYEPLFVEITVSKHSNLFIFNLGLDYETCGLPSVILKLLLFCSGCWPADFSFYEGRSTATESSGNSRPSPCALWVSLTGHLEEKVAQFPRHKIAPLFFPIRAPEAFPTQPSLPWGGISLNCTGKDQTHHFIIRSISPTYYLALK